jgi:hypothetical protein
MGIQTSTETNAGMTVCDNVYAISHPRESSWLSWRWDGYMRTSFSESSVRKQKFRKKGFFQHLSYLKSLQFEDIFTLSCGIKI